MAPAAEDTDQAMNPAEFTPGDSLLIYVFPQPWLLRSVADAGVEHVGFVLPGSLRGKGRDGIGIAHE